MCLMYTVFIYQDEQKKKYFALRSKTFFLLKVYFFLMLLFLRLYYRCHFYFSPLCGGVVLAYDGPQKIKQSQKLLYSYCI
uniref:Uncharacterized protein n=1 Tax=Pyxicephalus adspersus TaxID=30357 RepID=A0AAV3A8G6_PYXAD|nr:TPA: hypothetical protein GDO54_007982 [Pyxicephalus adspersus]